MVSTVRQLSTVLLLACASGVLSQERDTPSGASLRSTGGLGLGLQYQTYAKINVFRDPRVQEELNLTEAQKGRVKTLNEELARARRRFLEDSQKQVEAMGEDPDRQALAEVQTSRAAWGYEMADRWEAGLRRILDRGQAIRLDQSHYQVEGPMAFKRPEVQRRLNLAPEQIQEITEIVDRGNRELTASSRLPA